MNNEQPLVSIIIPLYNAERFIAETIRTLKQQTYSHWEVLIINNCSTDKSVEIVKSETVGDSRFSLHSMPKNSGGPAGPRNKGLDLAKGELIAFLDADDLWNSRKLELQVTEFQSSPELQFVLGPHIVIDESGREQSRHSWGCTSRLLARMFGFNRLIQFSNLCSTSTVMMRREAIGSLRFCEKPEYKAIEDWAFWLLVLKPLKDRKNVRYLKYQYFEYYRVHSSSTSDRLSDRPIRQHLFIVSDLFLQKKISFWVVSYWTLKAGLFFLRKKS